MFERLRYIILRRAIKQFIAEKSGCKMPDFERLSSIIVILEDLDKEKVRAIEERFKNVFGINRIRLIIISEKASNDMLLSDQYCEVTTKDFGFMKVLKAEKQEEIHKLPMTQLLVNMAQKHIDISDYLATLPHASFRVSFTKSQHFGIYDLILCNNTNPDPIINVQALHDYLRVLSGN
ncbi:MAG: hypothetical protein J6P73_06625 [Bacteroidales bacterium]|nr:hypothetical protein [Bacteroidales bacterium]